MKPLLKKHEVAELFGVSQRTVDRLVSSGELSSVKIGKSRRFRQEAVESFLRRSEDDVLYTLRA